MAGEEADNNVQAGLHEQSPDHKEGEGEPGQEHDHGHGEEANQGSRSLSSLSSSSGASSKVPPVEDGDRSPELPLPSSQLRSSGNVSGNSAPPPRTPACIREMETRVTISALTERTRSFPSVTVELPGRAQREGHHRSIDLEEDIRSAHPQAPSNARRLAPAPFIRDVYPSQTQPSPATGIGALLQLHPSPHLPYDLRLRHPPAQRLLDVAGTHRANMPTSLTASGFNLGSSNLLPLTVTLPPPPGGSRPRITTLASMAPFSSCVQHRQLPQLSLSTNPQVSVPVRSGIVMPPPGFPAPLRPQQPQEVRIQGLTGRHTAGPSTFCSPRGRGAGGSQSQSQFQQQLSGCSFRQVGEMGAPSNNYIRPSSLTLQSDAPRTNDSRPLEVQGNLMNRPRRQLEAGEPSSRPSKVQVMSRPDMITQPSPNLQLPSRNNNFLTPFPSQRPRYIRNSLYDPMYEAMGLPVDPHLRLFLASQYGRKK